MTAYNSKPSNIFCPYCGRRNPEDARFCTACGRDIPRYDDHSDDLDTYSQSVPSQGADAEHHPVAGSSSSYIAPALTNLDNIQWADVDDSEEQNDAEADWEYTDDEANSEPLNEPLNEPLIDEWIVTPVRLQAQLEGHKGRPICRLCSVETNQLRLLTFDRTTGLCADCKKHIEGTLLDVYLHLCPVGIISPEAKQHFEHYANVIGLDPSLAFSMIRKDALAFFKRTMDDAPDDADIVLTDRDYENLDFTLRELQVNPIDVFAINRQARMLRPLMPPRMGQLPIYRVEHIYLDSDELCHLDVTAIFINVTQKVTREVRGEFIATNKRMIFRGSEGTIEIPWKNVLRVGRDRKGIDLELSSKRGDGYYRVGDPLYVSNLLSLIARM